MSDYFVSYLTGKAGEDRDVIEWKHGGSSDPEERAVPTLTKRDLPQHRFALNPHQIVFEDHHYHEDIEPGKSYNYNTNTLVVCSVIMYFK